MGSNGVSIENRDNWILVSIEDRVDAFNWKNLTTRIDGLVGEGQRQIALDLGQAQFLSLPSIKYFSAVAEDLGRTGGQLALVAPSEKLKRQFDIFASLESFELYRSYRDWEKTYFNA